MLIRPLPKEYEQLSSYYEEYIAKITEMRSKILVNMALR